MKCLLSSVALLALLAASPLLSGCGKKDDPAATTGTMSGTVAPVGSIALVAAKTTTSSSGAVVPGATSGAFSFASLAPGSYTLSFTPATGYKPVADRTVSIVAGQNTAVGTVQATSDGTVKGGTMTWTVNGQAYTATTFTGKIDTPTGGGFNLTGQATTGNQADAVTLLLNSSFTGSLGTYVLASTAGGAYYSRYINGNPVFVYTCSSYVGGTGGSLVLTQYDATAGTAAGTFSFVAGEPSVNGAKATVSNGTFSVRF